MEQITEAINDLTDILQRVGEHVSTNKNTPECLTSIEESLYGIKDELSELNQHMESISETLIKIMMK